ncbi:MAG: hypothetical protein DRN15_06640 [Thermoprotei archaeon]|nr:MAG: hypothetical protein DRM97_07325 [Thermoprotei archaeon]RLF23380.1 MAG: hypothetical protein DRN15_06640 [Thermoprotei archaeon]
MPRAIFLTGRPGVGKTTVLMKIVEELKKRGFKVGGMISREVREGGRRVGFEIVDIYNGTRGVLAHVEQKTGPRVGRYRVNLKDLNEVGVRAIERAINECDVIVIDEVGKMELFSSRFVDAVKRALHTEKIVLGTVHLRAYHPLARSIREGRMPNVKVYVVDERNRRNLHLVILRELLGDKP